MASRKTPAAKNPVNTTAPEAIDAVTLLKADHEEVRKLYKRYEKLAKKKAPGEQREELARAICTALTVHARIEEEIFYPAAREVLPQPDLLEEAAVEHDSAKALIAQIRRMSPDDAQYDAKVIVLCEYVEHHVQEEENELFPKCTPRRGMDLKGLGETLARRKAQLMTREAAKA